MRILMLSQFYPPVIGGEERHVINLSESLARRGHAVTVATLQHPDRPPVFQDGDVTVRSISSTVGRITGLFSDSERPHAPPFPDPEVVGELSRIMDATKPDIVHAHNWLVHSFLPLKRSSRAGLIATLHSYSLVCAKHSLMRGDEGCPGPTPRRCIPCASRHYGKIVGPITAAGTYLSGGWERRAVDRFIVVSRAVAKLNKVDTGKVPYDVLPTFIPDDLATLKMPPDDCVSQLPAGDFILFVGDLSRRKGVHILLDAYARLPDAPPLVLIGRRCQDTPPEHPPNVKIFESWPHAAVMHAWSRCLFGVAPSIWGETCGTVAMEANAVGKPVVATLVGGLADLVVHGETGLQLQPNDVGALAEALAFMLREPAQRELMGRKAKTFVERFMAKTIVPQIEQSYAEVVQRRASANARLEPAHV